MEKHNSVLDVLDNLDKGGASALIANLDELKYTIRHNLEHKPLGGLNDPGYQRVLERLIKLVVSHKTGSKARLKTSSSLEAIANTVRFVIDIGLKTIKSKTVKFVLDHICYYLHTDRSSVYGPLELEYAKALSCLLSYGPHVGHLPEAEWSDTVSLCFARLQPSSEQDEVDNITSTSDKATNSRSFAANRNNIAPAVTPLMREMLTSLSLLTNVTTARIPKIAGKLARTAIHFLKTDTVATSAHEDAIRILSNVTQWASSEDIRLVRKLLIDILHIVRKYWSTKIDALREAMTGLLAQVQPYLLQSLQTENDQDLTDEVKGLYDIVFAALTTGPERDLLSLSDVTLTTRPRNAVSVGCMALEDSHPKFEQQWTVLQLLSEWAIQLSVSSVDKRNPDNEVDMPRKRLRRTDEVLDLIQAATSDSIRTSIAALQVLAFGARALHSHKQYSRRLLNLFAEQSTDNRGIVASWAMLASASMLLHSESSSEGSELVASLWKVAVRSMSTDDTCRASCQLLLTCMQRRCISEFLQTDLMQQLAASLDLSGPSVLADSAIHLLEFSIHTSRSAHPAIAEQLTQRAISWFTRKWTPSKTQNQVFAHQAAAYSLEDLTALLSCLLGQTVPAVAHAARIERSAIGIALLYTEKRSELSDYLLLRDTTDHRHAEDLPTTHTPQGYTISRSLAVSVRSSLLGHLLDELPGLVATFKPTYEEHPAGLTPEACSNFLTATHLGLFASYHLELGDTRSTEAVQQHATALLKAIETCACSQECKQAAVDYILRTSSANLAHSSDSLYATQTAKMLHNIMSIRSRHEALNSQDQGILSSSSMGDGDSQETRQSAYAPTASQNVQAATHSSAYMRTSVWLQAVLLCSLDGQSLEDINTEDLSRSITDHVLEQPIHLLPLALMALTTRLEDALTLSDLDVQEILSACSAKFLRSYALNRSELAQCALMGFMTTTTPIWTDQADESLYALGLDVYEWFSGVARPSDVLSYRAQQDCCDMLLAICKQDPNFGSQTTESSARTTLFQLLKKAPAVVLFHVAPRLPSLFSLYSLSTHNDMFADVQESLPVNAAWSEGIAMRLYILAGLGSEWHSLLRLCVYYIFETAGQVASAAPYAARSLGILTKSLSLDSTTQLFNLFCPQLLHTWLDGHVIQDLPYQVFGYVSLKDFLFQNKNEISAQLFLRKLQSDLDFVSAEVEQSVDTLLAEAFDRAYAYAMSYDITNIAADNKSESCEARLRGILGGKDKLKTLIRNNHGAIIGRVLLAANRDDLDEKWLEKREAYQHASATLLEMKEYSASGTVLPPSQQPHFKSKYLLDQFERLGRRLGHTSTTELWDSAAYVLATQMLFDNTDQALGPMHHCAMLQKQRLMIALAQQVPLQGFALETTLRFVLPFIDNPDCAEDAIGIFHYLMQKGTVYLITRLPFLWNTAITVLLRLSKCETESQRTATQTSQQRETLQRMRKLKTWLISYLQNVSSSLSPSTHSIAEATIRALRECSLPGNCAKGTAESQLMLLLLDPEARLSELLDAQDRDQLITLMAEQFEMPSSTQLDCLDMEQDKLIFAKPLWHAAQLPGIHDNFILWSALIAGHAFAASGRQDLFEESETVQLLNSSEQGEDVLADSRRSIVEHITQLTEGSDLRSVSLSLSTIRSGLQALNNNTIVDWQGLFPEKVMDALGHTQAKYRKSSLIPPRTSSLSAARQLQQALTMDIQVPEESWLRAIAQAICMTSSKHSFVHGLDLLLENRPQSAKSMLPALVHLVLAEHITDPHVVKDVLSKRLRELFKHEDNAWNDRQRFLLKILLYLLRQPYPNEITHMERLKWVDCDYMHAAECAARCSMPTTALMLAELARSNVSAVRRPGARTSAAKETTIAISNELLIKVFELVDEPDSYYGVPRPASLQSFLDRVKYEGDARQALAASSARLGSLMAAQPAQHTDDGDMLKSLSALNLDSLAYSLAQHNQDRSTGEVTLFDNAQSLRQWHLSVPENASSPSLLTYRAYQALSQAVDMPSYTRSLQTMIGSQVKLYKDDPKQSLSWMSALASMAELRGAVTHPLRLELLDHCDINAPENAWLATADIDSTLSLIRGRTTMAGVLSNNKPMLEKLQIPRAVAQQYEIKALITLSAVARSQLHNELAQSTSWLLQDLVDSVKTAETDLLMLAKQEIASVLWSVGDTTGSVDMLQQLITTNSESIDAHPAQAGLLSQLGQQLADARLERPSEILKKYLQPSIEQLQQQTSLEAGRVYHTFAAFCDAQLQNTDASADFQRITKLRQAKQDEVEQLETVVASLKKTDADRKFHTRALDRAKQWFKLDDEEFQRMKHNRDVFAEQALQNYMHTLRATDKHDICVLRLFALWLEYGESQQIQSSVSKTIGVVPTWKFVVLMNQLISRLKGNKSELDKTLLTLLFAMCSDHPYHTVHHLYAARKFPGKDDASVARREAADKLALDLARAKGKDDIIMRMLKADSLYRALAEELSERHSGKYALKDSVAATRIDKHLPKEKIAPATIELALQPDGVYKDVPVLTKIASTMTIMTGLSAPKLLTMTASDGKQYKQLFKGGNDDLRQDAIMEQVFSEVSKMLRNHKASRRRDLHVRTYKVIPLTNRSGIIEFVPNSLPINDFLQPAHLKYYPNSLRASAARQKIAAVAEQSRETRVKEFRKICDQMPPVMRYFFFERFKDSDEWFRNRTAYTRTTATISMLGQVLGLGDRHCHNILLDEHNGEVIHIDLGVAFEAGRVLPIPELVPFRLTRDIVDGMGVTGTEGIFKRCAEFTLEALRKDKDAIMTLLNVLRYDPLYSWTLSPIRAKRMQQQQSESNVKNGDGKVPPLTTTVSRGIDEASEAERALSIVEKKLGNALSAAASVSELIQVATDERNLATLFNGWAAFY